MSNLTERAEKFAKLAHMNQMRKTLVCPCPYWTHPEAVAKEVQRRMKERGIYGTIQINRAVAAAWLHDVIEDTEYTKENLQDEFSDEIVDTVVCLTREKDKGENYFDFIQKVDCHNIARIIKICDIEHNMSDLKEGTLKDKYRFALYMLKDRM